MYLQVRDILGQIQRYIGDVSKTISPSFLSFVATLTRPTIGPNSAILDSTLEVVGAESRISFVRFRGRSHLSAQFWIIGIRTSAGFRTRIRRGHIQRHDPQTFVTHRSAREKQHQHEELSGSASVIESCSLSSLDSHSGSEKLADGNYFCQDEQRNPEERRNAGMRSEHGSRTVFWYATQQSTLVVKRVSVNTQYPEY